jgi:hypothetical protein
MKVEGIAERPGAMPKMAKLDIAELQRAYEVR